MVELSANISADDVRRFNDVLADYARKLGHASGTAPQRAAIQICKSFRAATRKAPKYARSSEYSISKSDTLPKRITTKEKKELRRFHVDRTVRKVQFDAYAEKKADIRRTRLLLHRAGLAKQSWGWVMHNIFTGAAPDTPWQRRKRDRRDPKDATRESFSTVSRNSGIARIVNRIDYITDAFKEGTSVDGVIEKARNWMMAQVNRVRPNKG